MARSSSSSAESAPGHWRKRSARFEDIAREAGVSTATVDRVLNERGSVSQGARERVIAAARRLDVGRVLPQVHHHLVHVELMLPLNDTPFFVRLREHLQQQVQMLDRRVVVHLSAFDEHDDRAVATHLRALAGARQGFIVTAPDTPQVREALDEAMQAGTAVVTLVTDVSTVLAHPYVGIDHEQAGRTAGHLLARLCRSPGRVLLLSSRSDYRAHQSRLLGCREELQRAAPHLRCEVVAPDTADDADRCYFAVMKAVAEVGAHGPVVGLYNTGDGSAGIEAALLKHGLAGQVAWIGHEVTDAHRRMMRAGLMDFVIDQDPRTQALVALQHMLHANGMLDAAPAPGLPVPKLHCSANLGA